MATQEQPDAPQETSPELDPSLEYDDQELEEYEEAPFEEAYAPAPPRGGTFDTFLFAFTGFAMAGGGIALAAAPHYSWKVMQVAQQLEGMGFHSGVFVVGGLILFAMGLVHRAVGNVSTAPPAPVDDQAQDFALVAEQLATDLAELRDSLLDVTEEVTSISASQETVIRQTKPVDSTGIESEKHNAMFALAASLDQLNARLDEKMHHLDVQLRSQFDQVGATIAASRDATHTEVRALAGRMQARSVDQTVPTHSDAPPPPAYELPEAPAAYEEELEVLVDLEEEPEEHHESAAEFFETLEELDQLVSNVERATEQPALDLDGLDLSELGIDPDYVSEREGVSEREEPGPLPETNSSMEDRLESLLPDETLSRALDPDHRFDR